MLVPGLHVWMVGDGKQRGALEALTDELRIRDRVRFTGWVDEPIHHIAAGDVFILPSRHEPLGNVLLEAWQAGVPSVSTRCEGPNWFMRDGTDGLMVPIDDAAAAAAAISRLLSDPDQAGRYAANAAARLDEMFSTRAIVKQYRALYAMPRGAARRLGQGGQ